MEGKESKGLRTRHDKHEFQIRFKANCLSIYILIIANIKYQKISLLKEWKHFVAG